MLTKPTNSTIAALARFARSTDGVEILKFLDSELEQARDLLVKLPEGQRITRIQGHAQFLTQFVELVRAAPEIEKKSR